MPLVRQGPGLIGTAARAGVAAGVAGRVRRRQEMRWAAQEQAAYQEQAQQAAPAQGASAPADDTAELERLAKLRDEGVITAEDFEAKKKQLLGI
jgi:membrane protease subunit (stomatin/prohibitin family)